MKDARTVTNTAFALLLIVTLQGFSCIGDRYRGPVEKETRNVSGFNAIEVSHGIDVNLSFGSDEYVEVEAPEDLMEHIVTEVKGDKLKIYVDKSFNWNSQAKVFVQARKVAQIHASSGSDVRCEDVIETKKLELRASGGSDMRLEVITKTLNVHVSGGADITLIGSTDFIKAETSGGSDMMAMDLIAKSADLEASGGSDIRISVMEELDARASGGADIVYSGNPTQVNVNSSASADIKHRN